MFRILEHRHVELKGVFIMAKFVISFKYDGFQVREMDLMTVKICDRYEANKKTDGSTVQFIFEDEHHRQTMTVYSSLEKTEQNVQKVYLELFKVKELYNILSMKEFEGIVNTVESK
jgi:hypothetical protein